MRPIHFLIPLNILAAAILDPCHCLSDGLTGYPPAKRMEAIFRPMQSPTSLEVDPTNLVIEVLAGDPTPTRKTFSLKSVVDSEQSWSSSFSWPQIISLSPSSGVLPARETTLVTVSVLSSNAVPISTGGYLSEISIMPWGRPKVWCQVKVRPSARLEADASSLVFGLTPEGMVLQRELTIHNTGFNTAGAGIDIGNMFTVVKNPASDPTLDNHWRIYLSMPGNTWMTNHESRVVQVIANCEGMPPGRYHATLIASSYQLAEPLEIPLELVVGEDLVTIDRLTPLPGTTLVEQSKVTFEAQVSCQVQSQESAHVHLVAYHPSGWSLGDSERVYIQRQDGLTNLVLRTPPVTISHLSNIIVKADIRGVGATGDEWVYSQAYVYPVSTQADLTNLISLGEKLQLPGSFNPVATNHVQVQFSRSADGTNYTAEAPIEALTATTATVRVPVNLLGPNHTMPLATNFNSNVTVRVITGLPQNPQTNVLPAFRLVLPRLLVHDEVCMPPILPAGAALQVPTTRGTLLQFLLNHPLNVNDPATVATFMFYGQSTDGVAGLRILNTALAALVRPLQLANQVRVFQPVSPGPGFESVLPFHIPNLASGDEGLQFDMLRDGLHIIVVGSDDASSGPFPAPFQIHLAGNVGVPRKLINDTPEFPRGTRWDTLFNHPAPRQQSLAATMVGSAETAPFKFANLATITPFAVAVLIPPAPDGFPGGTPIVRAPDPAVPLEVTTPTARTPANSNPTVGIVIDFTQLPDPASVVSAPSLTETVGAVIGRDDGHSVTLPLALAGETTTASLILDMGSGQEITDGSGADFKVFATAGSYTVAVANTPYVGSWVDVPGTFSGSYDIDLNGIGLTIARYVRITAAPTVTLDAVQKLHFLCDQVDSQLGPVTHVPSATMLVRRAKAPETVLDPFLQLIAPNGDLYGENESGFGDDLSPDLSDSALIRLSLPAVSLYRYLVKGYDKVPDAQAIGTFFTRLETEGNYDPSELVVSQLSEAATPAQKQGKIDRPRQRDSYLFQANPGTPLHLAVNAITAGLDPVVELYDPEDYLIGANDNSPNRGRDALLSVTLPASNRAPLPSPSTYRIVVQAIDQVGNPQSTSAGMAHPRIAPSGNYELKVFTGELNTATERPRLEATINSAKTLLRLQIDGVPGQTLILESTAALGRESWSPLSTIVLTNTPHIVELPLGTGARFYRLQMQ